MPSKLSTPETQADIEELAREIREAVDAEIGELGRKRVRCFFSTCSAKDGGNGDEVWTGTRATWTTQNTI